MINVPQTGWKAMRASVVAAFGASAVLILTSCGGSGSSAHEVVVASARSEALAVTATGQGTFQSSVDVPVTLGFRGTVTSVLVQAGQEVKARDILFTVTSSRSDNTTGKLGLRLSSLAAEVRRLEQQGAKTAALTAARAQFALTRDAYAVSVAGRGVLRAPVSGLVAGIAVKPGDEVVPDQPLLHVVDPRHLVVDAFLSSTFRGLVRAGDPATVRPKGLTAQPLRAKVESVSGVASDGGTFEMRLAVNVVPASVAPGTAATVVVPLLAKPGVAVNSLAVLQADTSPTVFVVDGDHVRQRSVVVGVSDGGSTQILSGLTPNDTVVIVGAQPLTDGAQVTVIARRGS